MRQTRIIEVVDHTTGEVMKTEQEFIIPPEENYIKIYIKDVSMLRGIQSWVSNALYELMKYIGYGNELVVHTCMKEDIAQELGTSINTINRAIQELHKKKILVRKARGVYIANPKIFGKGKWSDIVRLRIEINYSSTNGRVITTRQEFRDGTVSTSEL